MKLPKSLTQAIFIGITAANVAACSYDVSNPEDVKPTAQQVTTSDPPPPPPPPFCCPACGMG